MRLTEIEITVIKDTAKQTFGEQVEVWLFGSRVDDAKRGGDIDLLIKPAGNQDSHDFTKKITFLNRLEKTLGEQKIDVVIQGSDDKRPIIAIAHETGIQL